MLRYLADENFHGDITRGLRLRQNSLDIIRVQDTEIAGAEDSTVLAWAAQSSRIVLTHDVRPCLFLHASASSQVTSFPDYL